ncbi:hypothetical protein CSC2_03750 [Clostridium zeae]|uniref:LPXTG cell wall anchor domain-containing protein n=1 Tax=Clostridium zeae TaxID=2759022 RepID=A0ABQ1E537_9CLOT|nr:LPXTG cell wall anchor domain-containing protein [Clostridium zeae]GFZ29849.1 hypothetical protein CSC2_03750 [Clostridium zeae]
MKKRKKLSVAIVVMFLVQLIFGVGASKVARAEDVNSSVPQFLDRRKETVDFVYQYKDKTIVNNAVIIDYNIKFFVEENGKKHIISDDFNLLRYLSFKGVYNDNAYVVSDKDEKRSIYKVDLNTYKMEYVKEVPKYKDEQAYVNKIVIDSNGVFWYEASEHNIPIYDSNGRILDNSTKDIIYNDKGFSYETIKLQKGEQTYDSFGHLEESIDGSLWFNKTLKSGTDNKVYKISKDNSVKEYSINNTQPMVIYNVYPSNDSSVILIGKQLVTGSDGRSTEGEVIVQKYKINGDTLELTKEFKFPNTYFYSSLDVNGNVWINQSGVISKLEGNEFIKKYIVDSGLKALEVYDDKNLVACGIVGFGYTPIAIADPAEKPLDNNIDNNANNTTNTNINNNTSKNSESASNNSSTNANNTSVQQVINKEKFNVDVNGANAVLTLDSKQISKDSENTVVPTLSNSVQTVETRFDAVTTNGGKGSVKVNANNVSLVLPFSTIDYNGVNNGDYIKLREAIVKNDDSLSSIKDIGKLFDFSLEMYKNDGTKLKDIHSFKNGNATISVKLTNVEVKNLDINKLSAFYYNENTKSWENVGGSYNKGTMTFTFQTSHFSKYTIAQINGTLPQTGVIMDSTSIMLVALILILMGSIVLMKKNITRIKTSNR